MTEAEAKTKWCPFTLKRVMVMFDPSGGEQTVKQAEDRANGSNCLGSGCVMWRVTGARYTGREVAVRTPDGGGRIERETEPEGTCALANEVKYQF